MRHRCHDLQHYGWPVTRRFVDRMGRVITDPEVIEARSMAMQLHRLEGIAAKAGKHWPEGVSVGELAKASKLTNERVVAIVQHYGDAWLIGLIKPDGPMENWKVYQDGE